MKGQGTTEPNVSADENKERAFVRELCHWFGDGATAWLGTAAELLSELKGRAHGLESECWPENAVAVFAQLQRNTELLRSYGLAVHIDQQDNGPRLISIRQLDKTAGTETQESQSNSPSIRDAAGADDKVFAGEVMNADPNERGWQQAEGSSRSEDQALSESAELDATPSNVQANNNDHQQQQSISPTPDFSTSSDWHDIRTSLSGFETGNTVPTGIAHRMIITGIVILCVVGVLLVCAWIWPGSFPIALFARSMESHSNSASIGDSRRDVNQKFAASDNAVATAVNVPEGIPQLLQQSRAGDADAQYLLGMSYETGNGVEQDFVNAYVWYVIADASGNPKGKNAAKQLAGKLSPSDIASVRLKLGSIYASGAYVPRDYSKAYVWFSLAAAAGDPAGEREKSLLAQKMTEQEITEANNRASDWLKRHEKQVR